MPRPNTKIKFNNFDNQLLTPFVIYADFESFILPIQNCDPNPNEKNIKNIFLVDFVKPLDDVE